MRKDRKEHGLQRWIEGPEIAAGERALVVEDTVTSGGSLDRRRSSGCSEEGIGSRARSRSWTASPAAREAIEAALGAALPYAPLFTIDDVYPDRPDR